MKKIKGLYIPPPTPYPPDERLRPFSAIIDLDINSENPVMAAKDAINQLRDDLRRSRGAWPVVQVLDEAGRVHAIDLATEKEIPR